jgi:hypothetical protein
MKTNEELNTEDKNIYEYTLRRAMVQLGQRTNRRMEKENKVKRRKQSKKITHQTRYLLSLGGYHPVNGCCECDSHQKIVMEDKGNNKSRA